jgi:hypothetical protein
MLYLVVRRWPLLPVFFCLLARFAAAFPDLSARVVDENGVAVVGARLSLTGGNLGAPLVAISDESGRFTLRGLPLGRYSARVEKLGFYAVVTEMDVEDGSAGLEIMLNHTQEFEETVNVDYSAPRVDPRETSAQDTLTAEQIQDLPFSSTHDFRNSLPLMPGVFKDNSGRLHIGGGGENQAYYSLDGFNITSPVSGTLQNRISVDALRSVSVETSRFSAEYGKGSAGVLALETARGDDHYRFSATNFTPSFEFHDGLTLSNWTPRATVSGPIAKGRAWFFNALDLQYDLNIVDELPSGANTNRNWTGSNMSVFQFHLTGTNILTSSILVNFQNSHHWGISPLDPVETSRDKRERFYFVNLKDQTYFSGGWVLETGAALNRIETRDRPLGTETYTISPQGRSGNYYQAIEGETERFQALSNITTPEWHWLGAHRLKFGVDANHIHYSQEASRHAYEVLRASDTLSRAVDFTGVPVFSRDSSEFSSFGQDRWSPVEKVVIEAGLRLDWDQILRQPLLSPRLAVSWSPGRVRESRLSAGIGLYYDSINLEMLTRPLDQQRSDTFYAEDGVTVLQGPYLSRYAADESRLKAASYLNWSVGWEQRLPRAFYMRTSFMRKHGSNGWSYDLKEPCASNAASECVFVLGNTRRDTYSYLELTLTRAFAQRYNWLLSYARSSAHSSAVLDYSIEDPVFGPQGSGPLDWDSPNRLITWGLLPALWLKRYTIAYFAEWHSGFPYSAVNEFQGLVGEPNSNRFPDYFSLNVHAERRFRFWRHQWALRAGFNNVTGHHNPMVVNNNTGSDAFGQFSGGQGRVFTGRIRFLGKN